MSRASDWVKTYVDMRKGLCATRGSVGKSKGGNALPFMLVTDALLLAGTWGLLAEQAFRADGAKVVPEDSNFWGPTLHEYMSAAADSADPWVKVRVVKIPDYVPVIGGQSRPFTARLFSMTGLAPNPQRTRLYQEIMSGMGLLSISPYDLPRGTQKYLSLEVTERLWDGAWKVGSTIGSLDITDIPSSEYVAAFAAGAKEGIEDVKQAVNDIAEAAGNAAGQIAEAAGTAAGKAAGGFFSGTGLIGIMVVGVALSYRLGWF